jgi:hypothetical protein
MILKAKKTNTSEFICDINVAVFFAFSDKLPGILLLV